MRITESRLRSIIKEELDEHNKNYLAEKLESLYGRVCTRTVGVDDSEKIKVLSDSLIDLIQLLEKTIAR